jgi:hypothetical protein
MRILLPYTAEAVADKPTGFIATEIINHPVKCSAQAPNAGVRPQSLHRHRYLTA